MLIKIVVGDMDEDICGKEETYIFESNISLEEFKKAYKIGVKKIGLDILDIGKNRCTYTQDLFTKEEKKILKEFVPDVDWISGKDFVSALIKIAQIGNPKIEMSSYELPTFYAGGYSLLRY